MIFTCNIIADLLPLYADGICSEDTKTVVEHHAAECEECRKKLEAMASETVKEKNIGETAFDKHEKRSPENPFKKVRQHYIKLAAVTFLVCAVVTVLLGGAWYLRTSELYDSGYSWATFRTACKLKKIGGLMKDGKYRQALNLFEPYSKGDYTEAETEAFKDIYAEAFKRYFESYSIKNVSYYAENGKCERSYLHISCSNDVNIENRMYTFTLVFGYDKEGKLQFIEYNGEDAMYTSLPNMQLPEKNNAENYFSELKDGGNLKHFAYRFYTEERTQSVWDGKEYTGDGILGKTVLKNAKSLSSLLEDYTLTDCSGGDIRFGMNHASAHDINVHYYYLSSEFKISSLYFQETTLTIKQKNGKIFAVEFDLPVYSLVSYISNISLQPVISYEYAGLWNITYSENTPDDFKIRFEEIFA